MSFRDFRIQNLLCAACFVIQFGAAARAQPQVETREKIHSDIYAETYTDPLRDDIDFFQRARFEIRAWEFSGWRPYAGIENYKNEIDRNPVLEAGIRRTFFSNLTASIAVRREHFTKNEDEAFWSSRIGLVYGGYWDLPWSGMYADAYAEAFAVKPESLEAYSLFAGWVKTGYRAYAKNHFGFDPIVAGVRYYENSEHSIAGHDYSTLFLGMQGILYIEKPNVSASLLVSRAWTDSRTGDPENDYWAILALGFNW